MKIKDIISSSNIRMQLKDLAKIQIGYQHRDRKTSIDAQSTGTHRIAQIKDLDLDGRCKDTAIKRGITFPYLWSSNLYQFTPSANPQRYLITQGDVLFLSRGQRNFAVSVRESLENTIASYYFYILRPNTALVSPEYLAWFINQPTAQAFIGRHQRGSHIKIVPKNIFAELDVVVPPQTIQHSIVQLERLRQKETQLMAHLVHARKRLINGLSIQAASKALEESI